MPDFSYNEVLPVSYSGGDSEEQDLQAAKRKKDLSSGTVGEEQINEVLSTSQRMRARILMKRNKFKLKVGRARAARRMADPERLKRRAARQARSAAIKRILKGKSKGSLPMGARAGLERRINRQASMISRTAKRLLPKVRAADRSKFKR